MRHPRNARLFAVVLLAAIATHADDAGLSVRLAGAPAPAGDAARRDQLQTATEIVRDITEMSVASSKDAELSVRAAADRRGHVSVSFSRPTSQVIELDLTSEEWSVSEYARVARLFFAPSARSDSAPLLLDSLTELTPLSLVTANADVSRALNADASDPGAHESAALLIAAFALRQPVRSDTLTTWTVRRMTAHLAIARALRADSLPGADGELAEIARLALVGLEPLALARLDIRSMNGGNEAAWLRTLTAHARHEWRTPGAADDYQAVFAQMHGRGSANSRKALSSTAGRAVGPEGIDVLPWGAWAETARRQQALR